MNRLKSALSVLAFGCVALPALADPVSTSLYKHKHWEVEAVQYDDGSISCLAEVDDGSDSFTIRINPCACNSIPPRGISAKATPPTCASRSTAARPGR